MNTNEDIISLAKNGDQNALEQIYTENANKVYFLCLKILQNEDDASDLMQDTFIRAFSNLEQLKNPDSLTAWLLSIATSLCKNFLQKNKKFTFVSDNEEGTEQVQNIEDSDDNVLPERYIDNNETRRLVMEIIDKLPDGQRITIILFYYNGMSIKEISEVLECSTEAVKSRLYYARKTIKEEVLKLEKKGTKLYAVPIIPILGNILQYEAINTAVPATAIPISNFTVQASQASTNTPTATLTKAAETGGKSMSKMTKIIIAALAAVVVAGGTITAVVISSNNRSTQVPDISKDEKSIYESSYSEYENSENSGIYESNESNSQEEPLETNSDTSSEIPQKSEFEQIAENMTAHYISSKVLSAEELEIKNDYGPNKYTVLTFMLTLPEGSKSVNDSLGSTQYPIICDKNGERLRSSLSSFNMNDGSSVYIAVVDDEQTVEDMNIKLYASFEEKTSDIKEFDRSETELKFASGKITSGDFVKINNTPYIYVGLKSTTDGTETGTEKNRKHYKIYYHWFASLTSEPTDSLTKDLINIDSSSADTLDKCEYPIDSALDINDHETLSVISGGYQKTLYEGVKAEALILLPEDTENDKIREYEKNYLKPYTSDYSFNLNFNGKINY